MPFPWRLLQPVDEFGRFAGRVLITAVRDPIPEFH